MSRGSWESFKTRAGRREGACSASDFPRQWRVRRSGLRQPVLPHKASIGTQVFQRPVRSITRFSASQVSLHHEFFRTAASCSAAGSSLARRFSAAVLRRPGFFHHRFFPSQFFRRQVSITGSSAAGSQQRVHAAAGFSSASRVHSAALTLRLRGSSQPRIQFHHNGFSAAGSGQSADVSSAELPILFHFRPGAAFFLRLAGAASSARRYRAVLSARWFPQRGFSSA